MDSDQLAKYWLVVFNWHNNLYRMPQLPSNITQNASIHRSAS
jgi:hypothetical protein